MIRFNQIRHHQEGSFDNAAESKETTSRSRAVQHTLGRYRPDDGGRLFEVEDVQDLTGSDADEGLRTSCEELDREVEKARNLTRKAEANNCGNQGTPTGNGFDGRSGKQRGGDRSNAAPGFRQALPELTTDGTRDSHAINTAYTQLADKPVEQFQPAWWNALIDHAIVGTRKIRFVFRTGIEIRVPLG